MSVWIQNLKTRLEDRPVVILHGNVRDKYIDEDGRIDDNLTTLLRKIARGLPISFSELVLYDFVGDERREVISEILPRQPGEAEEATELTATAATSSSKQKALPVRQKEPPDRVLARWVEQLAATDHNRFVSLFYLDKLVAYKTSYPEDEKRILLWLEKIIENITPNHRLILVALQDTMVPLELYTNSPKTVVLPIPAPDRENRLAYLKHRLGDRHPHLVSHC